VGSFEYSLDAYHFDSRQWCALPLLLHDMKHSSESMRWLEAAVGVIAGARSTNCQQRPPLMVATKMVPEIDPYICAAPYRL
jgi:hypothetical protein